MLFQDGEIIGITRKRNLVPFTESKKYSKGEDYDVYDLGIGKVGISICYDINARTVERLKENGARVILAAFNDSGFGEVYHNIHGYYPVIKAAEYFIPIVVANEDGISQIINSSGKILDELMYEDKGAISYKIDIGDTLSIYLIIGQYLEWFLFIILIGWITKLMIKEGNRVG